MVKASGFPKPGGGDAKRINYYYSGCNVWISNTTKEIIERYYEWKTKEVSHEHTIIDEEVEGKIDDLRNSGINDYDGD
ncbi:hypothetical protein C1O63_0471 [Dehalococcoides mccartyi]|nr:hypothetical protein C1O63_0471 [Dehalococcoides mccartyi]